MLLPSPDGQNTILGSLDESCGPETPPLILTEQVAAPPTSALPSNFLLIMIKDPSNIYREQLSSYYHGLALWDPKPVESLYKKRGQGQDPDVGPGRVSIGDVGFIYNGAFMRMFNVTLSWDHPSNGLIGKPETRNYEPIESIGAVQESDIHEGEYCSLHVSKVNNVNPDTQAEPMDQTYRCKAQNRGALLHLPHDGHREEVIALGVFRKYIKENVDNWFRWSKDLNLPVNCMEDLILVTGCTLVTSWAAATFDDFDGHMPVNSDATTSLNTEKAHGGGAQYSWRDDRGKVEYHNSRLCPGVQIQPQNQCVFLKGLRAKRSFFRNIPMRAEAEALPDDPDNCRKDEIEVTQIPDSPKYRDPLVGILDYIIEKGNEDIIAIAHDDDLRLIEGVETLTAGAIEEFLHRKQIPLLVEDGAAILYDTTDIEPSGFDEREDNPESSFFNPLFSMNNPAVLPGTIQMTTNQMTPIFSLESSSSLLTPIPLSSYPYQASSVASSSSSGGLISHNENVEIPAEGLSAKSKYPGGNPNRPWCQCSHCGKRYISQQSLRRHRREQHPRISKCPEPDCEYVWSLGREYEIAQHLQRKHGLRKDEIDTKLARIPVRRKSAGDTVQHEYETSTPFPKHDAVIPEAEGARVEVSRAGKLEGTGGVEVPGSS